MNQVEFEKRELAFQIASLEIDTAFYIYEKIIKKHNIVPSLSPDVLLIDYYDDIKMYITPLFELWLEQEPSVPANEQEKEILLQSKMEDYRIRLFEAIYKVWDHAEFVFADLSHYSTMGYAKMVNEPRQAVW